MDNKNIIEVLIHSTNQPITISEIANSIGDNNLDIGSIIDDINLEYEESNKGFRIEKVRGGFQLLSKPEYYNYIKNLYFNKKKPRFSKAAIETLSIIAYKQPMTKAEIEHIRGVDCTGVIKKLLDRDLISIKGRDKAMGRALLYITTPIFLELFGLDSLKELPTLKELADIVEEGKEATEL